MSTWNSLRFCTPCLLTEREREKLMGLRELLKLKLQKQKSLQSHIKIVISRVLCSNRSGVYLTVQLMMKSWTNVCFEEALNHSRDCGMEASLFSRLNQDTKYPSLGVRGQSRLYQMLRMLEFGRRWEGIPAATNSKPSICLCTQLVGDELFLRKVNGRVRKLLCLGRNQLQSLLQSE